MRGKILRIGEQNISTFFKVATPCIDDHQFKEEEMGSVGEWSKVLSQNVLKCLCLARIGRPEFLWSVNKMARAITKWTRTCDKRMCTFDLIHSSHMWFQTLLSCGKHSTTVQVGTVSGLWFCRSQNQHQVDSLFAFSEVTRSCQKVRCARNRLQFHTVLQMLRYFLAMQVYAWMDFQLLIFWIC